MRKILLVGDGNHQFIRYLAKWLKRDNSDKVLVDILSLTEVKEESFYDNIYYVKQNSFMQKIPKVRALWKQIQLSYHAPRYDVINFHYVDMPCAVIHMLKLIFRGKVIISFWGSDFYRANKERKNNLKQIMKKSDIVTCTNPKMRTDIQDYLQDDSQRISVVRFGLEPLENLRDLDLTKEEGKKNLGIEEHKLVVCIGYNRSPHQHHVKIINSIESVLSQTEKDKIIVLLPLTYGNDLKYFEDLKLFLMQVKIEFKTFLKFMTNEEVAILRQATDIFIQLQTTDQFSGSMQEHMYAKNLVITGSWLPYKILEENNVYFRKIDNVYEVGNDLSYCMKNLKEEMQKVYNNDKEIYNLSGWPNVIADWNSVYGLNE